MPGRTTSGRLSRAIELIEAGKRDPGLFAERDAIVVRIRAAGRRARYALKLQQKVDRALESYVRRNYTDWAPDKSEAERDKANKKTIALIRAARDGTGDEALIEMASKTNESRAVWDKVRSKAELDMEKQGALLPVAAWVMSIPGVGLKGLGQILTETGPLDNYPNPAKVWKRLGFHTYEGLAMSTWKRDTWRPRALTKDEWTEQPFSSERYAVMAQIATWLVNKQCIAADKSGTEFGQPIGDYGRIYVECREKTKLAHPDWSLMHARRHALRIVMKQYTLRLWEQWIDTAYETLGQEASDIHISDAESADGQLVGDIPIVPAVGTISPNGGK